MKELPQLMNTHLLYKFPKIKHILIVALLCIIVRITYYWLSAGFCVYKIENTFPVTDEWKTSQLSTCQLQEVEKICAQPFIYLGKGSQAYAFMSQDGQYVLKFFKCYHLQPAKWLETFSFPGKYEEWRKMAIGRRQKKIDDTLKSYKLTDKHLRTESALIALQILPSSYFSQEVLIIDKLGRKHRVNLANYGFILQRKVNLILPKLEKWIQANNMKKAKKSLKSLIALMVERSKKGIQDSDPDVHKNAGLIHTKAVFIDVGSFHYNQDAVKEEVIVQDLKKITNRLKNWLENKNSSLAAYIDELIAQAPMLSWSENGVICQNSCSKPRDRVSNKNTTF